MNKLRGNFRLMKKTMSEEERIERRNHRNEVRRKNRPHRGKARREKNPDQILKIRARRESRKVIGAWKRSMKTWECHHFNGLEDPMNFAYLPAEEHRRLHSIYGDNEALTEQIILHQVKTPCVIFHDGKFKEFINGQFQVSKEV